VRIPTAFPVNGLYALRGAISAQRAGKFAAYHQAMFRATWQPRPRHLAQGNPSPRSQPSSGFPRSRPSLDDASIKDELRTNTDEAIRRGAFGVPTFFVGPEMFLGPRPHAPGSEAALIDRDGAAHRDRIGPRLGGRLWKQRVRADREVVADLAERAEPR